MWIWRESKFKLEWNHNCNSTNEKLDLGSRFFFFFELDRLSGHYIVKVMYVGEFTKWHQYGTSTMPVYMYV